MFNGLLLNPAYAGSHKYFSANALYRNQWTSFTGAPKTSLFVIDGPLKKEKMGVGLIIENDKIGITNQTDIYANYAYHLKIGPGKLSFGLKAGISSYTSKFSSLKVVDIGDDAFMSDIQSAILPKFGFGTFYYAEKFYAGFSVPSLVTFNPLSNNVDLRGSTVQRRHYYFTGGYVLDANEFLTLKPSVLIKYTPSAKPQIDFNLNALFYDSFWIGASYRTGDAVVAIAEYQVSSKFRIGYAFDCPISSIRAYAGYTHEIMIAFDFKKETIRTINPRYF